MKRIKQSLTNAIKIGTAAIFAIVFAEMMNLSFTISAGIVAILSVAPTKKETIKTASNRFYAFIVALILCYTCFTLLGYGLTGFFVYLFTFILICQWQGWASAMAMNSVLISHFLTFEVMNFATVYNEVALYCLGTGFGILVNLHLHENVHFMEQMEQETDEQIKMILERMAQRICNRDMEDYNGLCFGTIRKSLQKASAIAEENYLNKWDKKDTWDIRYIALREQQAHILYNIYKRVRKLHTTPVTAECISQFIQKLCDSYDKNTTADEFLEEFYELRSILRDSPLPVTRKEFEDRAELYGVLGDIEEFMLAKKEFTQENGYKL